MDLNRRPFPDRRFWVDGEGVRTFEDVVVKGRKKDVSRLKRAIKALSVEDGLSLFGLIGVEASVQRIW